jgi:rare lipoprotein A
MKIATWLALGLILGLSNLPPAMARERQRDHVSKPSIHVSQALRPQRGRASFYANRFHGRRMANGRRFDRNSNAAASRSLPLGTQAHIRNLENGRTTLVTIQDRGPALRNRVLDVSPSTATQLGMREQGTAMVEITPLSRPANNPG